MEAKIISSCLIRNHEIFVDGQLVFTKEKSLQFGEFIKAAYDFNHSSYPKFFKMDELCKLAFIASEFLLKNKNLSEQFGSENVSLVFANTSSSLNTDIQYYNTVNDFPSPSLFVYTLPNIMLGEISIRNKFRGENAFFIFPHFSPEFLCNYATQLIEEQKSKVVIIGWVELLKDNYEAFLCTAYKTEDGISLSKENLNKLFNGK